MITNSISSSKFDLVELRCSFLPTSFHSVKTHSNFDSVVVAFPIHLDRLIPEGTLSNSPNKKPFPSERI